MKSIQEVLFNSDYNDKYTRFTEELDSLNSKYTEYFDSRENKLFPEQKDSLALHYWMVNQYGTLTFGFLPESDIDENIKIECVNLFNRIFHYKLDTASH